MGNECFSNNNREMDSRGHRSSLQKGLRKSQSSARHYSQTSEVLNEESIKGQHTPQLEKLPLLSQDFSSYLRLDISDKTQALEISQNYIKNVVTIDNNNQDKIQPTSLCIRLHQQLNQNIQIEEQQNQQKEEQQQDKQQEEQQQEEQQQEEQQQVEQQQQQEEQQEEQIEAVSNNEQIINQQKQEILLQDQDEVQQYVYERLQNEHLSSMEQQTLLMLLETNEQLQSNVQEQEYKQEQEKQEEEQEQEQELRYVNNELQIQQDYANGQQQQYEITVGKNKMNSHIDDHQQKLMNQIKSNAELHVQLEKHPDEISYSRYRNKEDEQDECATPPHIKIEKNMKYKRMPGKLNPVFLFRLTQKISSAVEEVQEKIEVQQQYEIMSERPINIKKKNRRTVQVDF